MVCGLIMRGIPSSSCTYLTVCLCVCGVCGVYACVCACACACVRACVHACVVWYVGVGGYGVCVSFF